MSRDAVRLLPEQPDSPIAVEPSQAVDTSRGLIWTALPDGSFDFVSQFWRDSVKGVRMNDQFLLTRWIWDMSFSSNEAGVSGRTFTRM